VTLVFWCLFNILLLALPCFQPFSLRCLATSWMSRLRLILSCVSARILFNVYPDHWSMRPFTMFLVCFFFEIQALCFSLAYMLFWTVWITSHNMSKVYTLTFLPSRIPKDSSKLQLYSIPCSHSCALRSMTHAVSGEVLAFRMLAIFFRLLLEVSNSHNRKLLPAALTLAVASLLSRQQYHGFAKFYLSLHWYTGLC